MTKDRNPTEENLQDEGNRLEPVVSAPVSKAESDLGSESIDGRKPQSFNSILTADSSGTSANPLELDTKNSRRSIKPLLITAALLALVAALGFFGLMGWDSYQAQRQVEKQQIEEQKREEKKAEAIEEAESPFSVLVGEVDPPSEEPLELTVVDNQLKIGPTVLSIGGGTLTPTVNGCSLVAITDICLGARGKLGDGDFDVLLVKDISRTRLLDDPTEFSELKTAGGTTAASLAIDMGNPEEPARFGALTANGTTGFVLIFPSGTTADRVEEVLKAATVI